MRVEISGTALNCPLWLLDFAASLKALSHLPPGHWVGTDCGHVFIVILVSVGESPIQPSHGEFDKGKEIKTGERERASKTNMVAVLSTLGTLPPETLATKVLEEGLL